MPEWRRARCGSSCTGKGDGERTLALARRAAAAGYQALVLTVDAPVSGLRNREQRAGFQLPDGIRAVNVEEALRLPELQPGQSAVFDGLLALAPRWDEVARLCRHSPLPVLLGASCTPPMRGRPCRPAPPA